MQRVLFFLLFFLYSLFAKESKDYNLIDRYHDDLCDILVHTSNSIDNYFIEDDSSTKISTTRAELINSYALENNQKFEKDIRLRLRLSLPKIQKNLRLVFEDETNDNTLYDGTQLNSENIDKKQYYLRLEYFKYVRDKLNLAVAGGLRIRNSHLVPYLNIRSHYDMYESSSSKSEFYNRFRYYTDGEIEDDFEFNTKYVITDKVDFFWRNQLSYSNKDKLQKTINDVMWLTKIEQNKYMESGLGVVSQLTNFKDLNLEYIHLHSLYHHMFYKDWVYYELAPSLLWRESNDFETSYRLMLNFGILFDNA